MSIDWFAVAGEITRPVPHASDDGLLPDSEVQERDEGIAADVALHEAEMANASRSIQIAMKYPKFGQQLRHREREA